MLPAIEVIFMKTSIFNLDGKVKKEIDLPVIFDTPYRPDLITRVSAAIQSNSKQPQGRDPMAGKRTTAESWGTGRGRARVPRVKGGGTRAANSGAFINMAVGGRLAHPPRSNKVIQKKVNKKEKKLALSSAIAATTMKELVTKRGHKLGDLKTPILVCDDKIQTIKKTSNLISVFNNLGLHEELERAKVKKIRAGKGKKRGRKYKRRKGPLLVVEDYGIHQAARNIPGVDVTTISNLSIDMLAPGGHPGRLTLWSESAIKALGNME